MLMPIVAFFAIGAQAWDNTPPLPERVVGLGEGKGLKNINFEMHYDLMCEVSAALHPDLKSFLDMPYQNGTVRDAITVTYVFQPLSYHHEAWIPHKLLPFIIDECYASN